MCGVQPTELATPLTFCSLGHQKQHLSKVDLCDPGLSDHLAITSKLHLRKPPLVRRQVSARCFGHICVDELRLDLQQSEHLHCHVSLAATRYEAALGSLMEKYAPLRTKTITIRSDVEWFDDDIHEARRKRRMLERKWRKSGLEIDRQLFVHSSQLVSQMIQYGQNCPLQRHHRKQCQ